MEPIGQVALVTGANRGIGSAYCDVLLESGIDRLYACARDISSLQDLAQSHPGRVVPLALDLTVAGQIDAVINQCPDVDVVVSNAGRAGKGDALALDEDQIRDLFEVHVFGPIRLIRGLATGMTDGGRIVMVHSTAALSLSRGAPYYSASKAASMMVALGLREALAARGVSVTSVFPGFTNTDIIAGYDIAKAEPVDVARTSLEAARLRQANVYPDLYSRLVHQAMVEDFDEVMDEPGRSATAIIASYRSLTSDAK